MRGKRIFASVGTTKFDKLCQRVLAPQTLALFKSLGYDGLTLQIGRGEYDATIHDRIPPNFDLVVYSLKDSIMEDINRADLIVSHAGMGTCLEALYAGKPLLVVINDDLMDNHQTEIAERLQRDGHLYCCTCDTFEDSLKSVDITTLKPFPKSNAKPLFDYMDRLMS